MRTEASGGRVVVIGVGNTFRRDDGAGISVVQAVRPFLPASVEIMELDGEPARLVEAWDDAAAAFVVDAVRTGAPAGTIHRFDATADGLPSWAPAGGSHALGIAAAVDLGRALARIPPHLVLHRVVRAVFAVGRRRGPEVAAAVPRTVARLAGEVEALLRGAGRGTAAACGC